MRPAFAASTTMTATRLLLTRLYHDISGLCTMACLLEQPKVRPMALHEKSKPILESYTLGFKTFHRDLVLAHKRDHLKKEFNLT